MELRPGRVHVEVLRAVRPARDGAAHVGDGREGSRHPLRPLAPVPLAKDAERRDRIEGPVVVVVRPAVVRNPRIAERAARVGPREVLEKRTSAVGEPDLVPAVRELGAKEILPHDAAREHVFVLERELRERERVVPFGGREREAPSRAAGEPVIVEHRRRVALQHHASLLREHRLHAMREEGEARAGGGRIRRAGAAGVDDRRPVLLRPGEERLVP